MNEEKKEDKIFKELKLIRQGLEMLQIAMKLLLSDKLYIEPDEETPTMKRLNKEFHITKPNIRPFKSKFSGGYIG